MVPLIDLKKRKIGNWQMLANLILTQEGHFIVEAIFCQFNELWILTFPICCYKFHEKGEGEKFMVPKMGRFLLSSGLN